MERRMSASPIWRRSLRLAAVAAVALAAGVAQAQALTLRDGDRTVTLDSADLHALPQETLTIDDHGASRTFTGAPLGAVLDKIGAPKGEQLKGEALGYTVVATASDGYKVALSLSEIDPSLGDKHVIVADSEGGKPLDPQQGPLRLVVKDDKRLARSARNLVSIELKR
jgi:DMSO/TMAO reductase YedYZ molybdopterin-dependent catalytic subunit